MNLTSDDLLCLCVQRIAGTISTKDRFMLDQAISGFPKVRRLCAKFDKELAAPVFKEQLHPGLAARRWVAIKTAYEENLNKKKSRRGQ
ncbi:hypothetical protein [uncultured Chitinophaga sp.]|uniref:hypothetical protein n=1 Tax=uncultured Chitinophaga sp. TaxID=339340 RepID=UPI0026284026|nr:hypothetical protein [uncultured Chitinophaga sp.]